MTLPPLPSVSPSPSPSPSPAATPKPVLPELAKQQTSEGASAYATYYFETVTWSMANGDPSAMKAVSSEQCETCSVLIDVAEKLKNAGQMRHGGQYEVLSAVTPPLSDQTTLSYLQYKRSAASVSDNAGATIERLDAVPPTNVVMALDWVDDAWLMREWKIDDTS